MRVEATLTTDDLERVLDQFTPSVIRLGEAGRLELDEPTEVALLPELGMRVVCSARLHWPVLGVHVPVSIRSLAVIVSPAVVKGRSGDALSFKLRIEHVDVTILPAAIDDRVTARLNEELAKHHVELSWAFAKTLSHEFALPDSLESTSSIALVVIDGKARVTDRAMTLTVTFQTRVSRRVTT